MRTMMFLNAILVASLVVSFAVVDTRDPIDWLLFFGSIGQWPIFLFYVLPKVIQKFCLISSIESNKDFELIKKVTLSVKHKRVRQAVALMQMVRLRGKVQRLMDQGTGAMSEEMFNVGNAQYKVVGDDLGMRELRCMASSDGRHLQPVSRGSKWFHAVSFDRTVSTVSNSRCFRFSLRAT